MAVVETVTLTKGDAAIVVNTGSAEEKELRAQGYAAEGDKPAPKAARKAPPKAKVTNE